MMHARRQYYLDALGITWWLPRQRLTPAVLDAPLMEVEAVATVPEDQNRPPERVTAPVDAGSEEDWIPPMDARWELLEDLFEESPVPESPVSASPVEQRAVRISHMNWEELEANVRQCTACGLCSSRKQTVFGVGDRQADWLVVGEAPGADEDEQGEPFVGRAGKLLNPMLQAIGLKREAVFIANILKCRPPDNRDPAPNEAASCRPFLERQMALLRPRIILAVGRIAAQNLLATDTPIGKLRGRIHHLGVTRIPLVVTYHPAYLLRSPREKRKAWDDLRLARGALASVPPDSVSPTPSL